MVPKSVMLKNLPDVVQHFVYEYQRCETIAPTPEESRHDGANIVLPNRDLVPVWTWWVWMVRVRLLR